MEDIHSHRHVVGNRGFFAVARDLVLAVEFDDAQVDLRITAMASDRQIGLRVFVVVVQPVVPQRREHIAIHDQKRFGQILDEREWTDRAERLVLARVVDANAPLAAVAEIGHEQLREMARGERDVIEAGAGQLTDDDLEDRHIAHRHERLRERDRVWSQSASFPTGKDDGSL